MDSHILLCLICRRTGHLAAACTIVTSKQVSDDLSQILQDRHPFQVTSFNSESSICSRCNELDLLRFFDESPPWKSQKEFSGDFKKKAEFYVRSLGSVGSVQLWADCPLCRCLYAITPAPNALDQEIYLVPDWTISRLSGELGAVTMDFPEKQQYSTCLLSVLDPSPSSLPVRITAHRGDALCLLEEDTSSQRTLGGKLINRADIDVGLIHGWVQKCQERHDYSCSPVQTDALNAIRLLEVESRQIVSYPDSGCDYVALSYVWGNVPREKYRLGDTVRTLAATLEDAITITKKLGKTFLWIDSVCIDQDDERDLIDQVNRMWSIYRGAWITLIALSGSTADAGLSRLSRQQIYPQVVCGYRGKTLVSLMPTLSQQIWSSPWGGRAWTLQEGLLSARCLYISDHQIYYDCASMQCSESLEDSRSWAHNLTPASNPTDEGFVTWMLRQAGAGALRIPLDWPSRRLEHWGEKLNLYSYRDMTYPQDAVRAFLGVLQRLEIIYPKGFLCGLPVEDFDWALTWASQANAVRRQGFPSWSWAGWKGALFFGQPTDVKKTRRIPTCLQISYCKAGQMTQVFACAVDHALDDRDVKLLILHDPVHKTWENDFRETDLNLRDYPTAEMDAYLFMTAICFQFAPDFSHPQTKTFSPGQNQTFAFQVRDIICLIRIFSMDSYIPGTWIGDQWQLGPEASTQRTFILLARDHIQGFIIHKLMVIHWKEQKTVAERQTVLELLVPLDDLDVLQEFNPQKRRFVLK